MSRPARSRPRRPAPNAPRERPARPLRAAPGGLAIAIGLCGLTACGEDPVAPAEDDTESPPEQVEIFAEPVSMSPSDQLLANGGVESGTTLPASWWTGGSEPDAFAFEWPDGVASTGTRSIAVRRDAPSDEFGFWAQTLPVENPIGMTFELSVDVRLEDVEGGGVSIAVRGDDSALQNCCAEAFATTQGRITIDGTSDWAQYSVRLSSVPADVDRITIYFVYLPSTTGRALFDDAVLSASRSEPTVELQNTDMEDGDGYPDPWWWGGPGYSEYDFVWSDREAASGSRSLEISRGSQHPEHFGFWAQTIEATQFLGRSATLTVRVRSELVGQGAAIAIRTDDTSTPAGVAEAFATTQGTQTISGSGPWTMFRVTLEAVPTSSRSLTIYLIHLPRTRGTVHFDQVSLTPG